MTTLEEIKAYALQGIPRAGVEATIGHKLDSTELAAFHKAATVRRLKRAQEAKAEKARKRAEAERREKENLARQLAGTAWPDSNSNSNSNSNSDPSRPLTATERSRLFRERGRELPPIPKPADPWRRNFICRYSLLAFGLTYGAEVTPYMKPLLKRPPSERMKRFVYTLQNAIWFGGLRHVRWPRGKGKSTWVKIAIIWAALYGYKHFIVIVAKTAGMAKVTVEECWRRIHTSSLIAADFPEFAVPMNDVAFTPQRMRSQTCNGHPTYMKMDVSRFHFFKLPTVDGYPNTGAIIAYRGADQALRGINIDSARPDFIFIDDPQTDKDAKNPATVDKIEDNIQGAVLGSGEISERISAVMASTPIEPDDISERFADPKRHPEWMTQTEPFVVSWGPENLREKYLDLLAGDEARGDSSHATSTKFYTEHRAEIEEGAEMMDDTDFNPGTEVSAYQHALWLLNTMKGKRFYSEMQMKPSRSQGIYRLAPASVSERINHLPYGIVPDCCDRGVLAFVDVNAEAGLRWEIGAFGKGRILAVLAYGQYPRENVRLFPEGLPASAVPKYLAPALRTVARTIMSTPLYLEDGTPTFCQGVCFDGGWQTETVASVVADLNAECATPLYAWSKGFAATGHGSYSVRHHEIAAKLARSKDNPSGLKAGEECHLWETMNGVFLAFNSDYWKEISQTSFLAPPLSPSSSSFWGDKSYIHFKFAQEVCNEELVGKETSLQYGTKWIWKKDSAKPNHYGDTHAGLLVYGAIRSFFDPIASVISSDTIQRIAKRKVQYVYQG